MALAPEIDTQEIMGVLIGRLRPGAAWKSCTPGIPPGEEEPVTAHGMLIATWEDQVLTVPSEQEFEDEYLLYQADLAAATAAELELSDAATRFENAKQDFIDLRDILGPHYDNLTPTTRENLKGNFIDVATLQGLPENQFRNTVAYTLAAYVVMLDFARLEIARLRRVVNGQE